MIDILKIIFLPILMVFISSEQKLMNSINSRWHHHLVRYNFGTIVFITKPLHKDAYEELVRSDYYGMSIQKICRNVYVFDEVICDRILNDIYGNNLYFGHNLYRWHIVPESKQFELVQKYGNFINYIKNPIDELETYHDFVHKL